MRRHEVSLHYAEFKANGLLYRLLYTDFPELIPGHVSSDVFGFFGLGSGEFDKHHIEKLPRVKVIYPDSVDFITAVTYWQKRPEYVGFIDDLPNTKPMILVKGDDVSFYDLPINWEVYTQLGDANTALETLGALSRIHCAYPKLEQQVIRLHRFRDYVKLSGRP